MVRRASQVDTSRWPTRELILLEASRQFAARGYLGTSTRDVAAAVGIRQPSLYSHFGSKQEIAAELIQRDMTAGISALEQVAADGGGAAVELYRYLQWEVANVLGTPFDLRAVYVGGLLELPEFAGGRRLVARYDRLVRALLRRGIATGELLDLDVSFAQRTVDAIVMDTIRAAGERGRRHRDEPDLVASFVVRALLRRPSRLASVRAAAHRAGLPATG